MLEFIKEKKNCTGCTACLNICPINCISMLEDKEGFLYPVADDKCISCNKCKTVCPLFNEKTEKEPNIQQYSVAAVSNDKAVWKQSTSGGAFTEICKTYGDHETIVFGATFIGLKVVHSFVIGIENIGKFRKSKYVQSDLSDNFSKVKQFLDSGKKVIFSGTPCQISGLRSFLQKDYEKLLCIDLICHGVGSPKVFVKLLEYLGEKYNSKVTTYSFRHKKVINGNFREYVSNYTFENNRIKIVEMDEYNQLFLNQLCLRQSCGSNCRFRTVNRMGDITIADFKEKVKVFPENKDYRNYSTIVINCIKGDLVLNKLKTRMEIFPCDLEVIKENNPLFYRTTQDNPAREYFFIDFTSGININDLIKKYIDVKNKSIINMLKDLIPYRIRLWLIRNLKG